MTDIQELTVRGFKLLEKLKMLSPEESAYLRPYADVLETYVAAKTPAVPVNNVVSFEDAVSSRRVQRAEAKRLARDGYPGQHWVNEFGDDCFGYDND